MDAQNLSLEQQVYRNLLKDSKTQRKFIHLLNAMKPDNVVSAVLAFPQDVPAYSIVSTLAPRRFLSCPYVCALADQISAIESDPILTWGSW